MGKHSHIEGYSTPDDMSAHASSLKAASGRASQPLKLLRTYWRRLVQLILIFILTFLLAKIFWTLFAPLSAPATAPVITPEQHTNTSSDLETQITARNPFALATVDFVESSGPVTDEIAETSLDLTLHGIRIDGDKATAIIDVNTGNNDNRGQGVFSIGDELTDGVELLELYPGEAIISRDGIKEALRFEGEDTSASSSQGRAAATANRNVRGRPAVRTRQTASQNGTATPGASLQDIVQIRRRTQADGSLALFLYPGSNRSAFSEAGLVARDLLLSINGSPPPTDIRQLYQLVERFSGAGSVSLVVERNGTPTTVTVRLPATQDSGFGTSSTENDLGDEVEL